MEQIKKLLGETIVKLKLLVGVVIAGLVIGVAAWRKHVQDEWAKQDQEKESTVKKEAEEKLEAEKKKLDEQKEAEKAKVEAEAKQKQAELDDKKKSEAEKLKKADTVEVKKTVADTLGLKEGKKKGRPKK